MLVMISMDVNNKKWQFPKKFTSYFLNYLMSDQTWTYGNVEDNNKAVVERCKRLTIRMTLEIYYPSLVHLSEISLQSWFLHNNWTNTLYM